MPLVAPGGCCMIPHRGLALALTFASVLSLPVAQAAAAQRVAPIPPGTPLHRAWPVTPAVACSLGVVGAPALESALYPPDDVYYMLLKPSTCGQCSLTALANVHVTLVFPKPCAMRVAIGVVRAFGSTCLVPDVGQVLFGPVDTTLAASETDSTAYPVTQEFVIPVPSDWKLLGNAFASVAFPAVPDSCSAADQPQLALRDGCAACVCYEDFGGSIGDVCPGAAGLPLISADV